MERLKVTFVPPSPATFVISNQGLFVGPAVGKGVDAAFEAIPLTIERTDGSAPQTLSTHAGKHPDGHPLKPLYWLANYQRERGGLKAGQIVTTGSYAGAIDVPLDVPLKITFGELGAMEVAFRAAQT